jgi:hypothetical protein
VREAYGHEEADEFGLGNRSFGFACHSGSVGAAPLGDMREAGRSSPGLAAATPTWCRTSRQCGQRRSADLARCPVARLGGARRSLAPMARQVAYRPHGGQNSSQRERERHSDGSINRAQ